MTNDNIISRQLDKPGYKTPYCYDPNTT